MAYIIQVGIKDNRTGVAIKTIRIITGAPLKAAKNYVDSIRRTGAVIAVTCTQLALYFRHETRMGRGSEQGTGLQILSMLDVGDAATSVIDLRCYDKDILKDAPFTWGDEYEDDKYT
jgi:hypothetical protein